MIILIKYSLSLAQSLLKWRGGCFRIYKHNFIDNLRQIWTLFHAANIDYWLVGGDGQEEEINEILPNPGFCQTWAGPGGSYSWPDIYILHNWATTTKLCMWIINAGALYSSNIILLFVNISKILLLPAKEELPLKSWKLDGVDVDICLNSGGSGCESLSYLPHGTDVCMKSLSPAKNIS